MDSSITSERTRMREVAWASEKPSLWRRWVNFRVSKWWSRCLGAVVVNCLCSWGFGCDGSESGELAEFGVFVALRVSRRDGEGEVGRRR